MFMSFMRWTFELFVHVIIMLFIFIIRNVDLDVDKYVKLWTKRMVAILLAHLIIMLLFNGMIFHIVCIQCDRPSKVFNGLSILDLNVE